MNNYPITINASFLIGNDAIYSDNELNELVLDMEDRPGDLVEIQCPFGYSQDDFITVYMRLQFTFRDILNAVMTVYDGELSDDAIEYMSKNKANHKVVSRLRMRQKLFTQPLTISNTLPSFRVKSIDNKDSDAPNVYKIRLGW